MTKKERLEKVERELAALSKADISHLVAFAVAVLAVFVGALLVVALVAGLVEGWEGAAPMVVILGCGLIGVIGLAVGLLLTVFVALLGYKIGHLGWFDWRGRTAYLWFAGVILLAVAAQCLIPPWLAQCSIPPWESGSGKYWRLAGYAPLWNPPLGEFSRDSPPELLPVRVNGYTLAMQLFATGIFLVFYARGHLQYHRESDEMRMWRSTHREGPVLTYEELQKALRREIDEAKKDEDSRNTVR